MTAICMITMKNKKCTHAGGHASAIDEIHWEDDWSWVHACEGHANAYDMGTEHYNPKPAR